MSEVTSRVAAGREGGFRNFTGNFLIEEYLSGQVVSVDGIVQDNTPMVVGMSEFVMGPEPRFNQPGNFTPTSLSAKTEAACIAMAKKIIAVLGINNCGFHCELRVTPSGPVLVEIAARLAGGIMQPMYKVATGVDLTALLVDVWLGKKVTMQPTAKNYVLEKIVTADHRGRVIAAEGLEDAQNLPFVWYFYQYAKPNDDLALQPRLLQNLYKYAITAPDKDTLMQRSKQLEGMVRYTVK